MLSKLQFPNNSNLALLGDGTFGSVPSIPDDDWERQGQNMFTAAPGITIPTLPTGYVYNSPQY